MWEIIDGYKELIKTILVIIKWINNMRLIWSWMGKIVFGIFMMNSRKPEEGSKIWMKIGNIKKIKWLEGDDIKMCRERDK